MHLLKEQPVLATRAVIRPTEAGIRARCVGCKEPVKFVAKRRGRHVIVNVYVDDAGNVLPAGVEGGSWARVDHWHDICYVDAKEPHGPPAAKQYQPEWNEKYRRANAN